MILKGRNLIISVNSTALAGAKTCEIDVTCDTIPASSSTNGQWKHVLSGRKSWSISTGHLVSVGTFPTEVEMVATKVTIRVSDGTVQMQGAAIVKTWKSTGTVGNLAQGSFQFVGDGPLSRVTT